MGSIAYLDEPESTGSINDYDGPTIYVTAQRQAGAMLGLADWLRGVLSMPSYNAFYDNSVRVGMSLTNPTPQREELPTSHVSMIRNMPANNRLGRQVGADIGKAMVSFADWGNRVTGVGDMPRMVDYLSGDPMAMGAEVAINARYNPASLGVRPITNFDLLNSAMAVTTVTIEATAATRAVMAGRVSIGAAETAAVGGGGTTGRQVLYHYTNEAGAAGIVDSASLNPSLWRVGTKDVRYGNGQYVSDIVPGTRTSSELSRDFLGVPFQGKRFTHYVEIDATGLGAVQGRTGVYVIPNETPLDLTGRLISSGKVPRK